MFVAPGPMELVVTMIWRRFLALAKPTAAMAIVCSFCPRQVGSASPAACSASPKAVTLPCPKMANTPGNRGTSRSSMTVRWAMRNRTIAWATVSLVVSIAPLGLDGCAAIVALTRRDAAHSLLPRLGTFQWSSSRNGQMLREVERSGADDEEGAALMRIAVIGVGRMGVVHAGTLASLPGVDALVADVDRDRARAVAEELGVEAADDVADAMKGSDAVVIAAAT